MGKVVPFEKRAPRPQSEQMNSSTTRYYPSAPLDMFAQIEYLLEDTGLPFFLMRMQRHLDSLAGRVSNRNIAMRRKGLEAYTKEELEELARASGQRDWSIHPAFYYALIEEIRARERPTK